MELLDDEAQVESCLGPFGDSVSISARQVHGRLEIVLVLVQDRCTVCSKQGSEIILTTPDRTPR